VYFKAHKITPINKKDFLPLNITRNVMQYPYECVVFKLLQTSVIIQQHNQRSVSCSPSHTKEPHLCCGWIESITEFASICVMSHLFAKCHSQSPLAYIEFDMPLLMYQQHTLSLTSYIYTKQSCCILHFIMALSTFMCFIASVCFLGPPSA